MQNFTFEIGTKTFNIQSENLQGAIDQILKIKKGREITIIMVDPTNPAITEVIGYTHRYNGKLEFQLKTNLPLN